MFTINIKGKSNPKDPKMVKLEMIIFKTGYARVTKILNVSGPVKDWDNQAQAFKGNGSTLTVKNKILFELKNQYQKVAEDWDYEGRVWSPVELSHCFDEVQTRKEEVKSLSVLQMIDSLIEKFTHKERYKNGQIITSINNTRSYKEIKNSLSRFTQEVYNRSLSSYYFKEINERFLLDYILYVQKVGIENGNKGGLTQKLRRLRATCRYAEKQGIYGVDMKAFECLGDNIKWGPTTSKATSHVALEKLEAVDRSLFSKKEQLHLGILALKERYDDAEIPLSDRYLILHPKHVSDLLLEDIKLFKDLTNLQDGEPFRFAGFGCFSFSQMPVYRVVNDVLTKVPFSSAKQSTDVFASVAFYAKEVMKADGDIYMYSTEDDPKERATIVGFDKRFVALPIRNKGIGAIVSTTVN